MRCMKCGAEIPEGEFYCPICGSPVQLVPDYASLESLLAGEISGILDDETEVAAGKTRVIRTDDVKRQRSGQSRSGVKTAVGRQTVNMTPINRYSEPGLEERTTTRIGGSGRVSRNTGNLSRSTGNLPRNTGNLPRNTGNLPRNTGTISRHGTGSGGNSVNRSGRTNGSGRTAGSASVPSRGTANRQGAQASPEARRRRQQEMIARRKKEQRRTLIIIAILLVVIFAGGTALLLSLNGNSYSGVMGKAEKAYEAQQYDEAIELYTKAAGIKQKKADPYVGIGRCYKEKAEYDNAELVFFKAIKLEGNCTDAYLEIVALYEEQEDYEAIAELFVDVTDKTVLKACADYIAEVPQITPLGGSFDEPIEVSMKVGKGEIHYTTDGSEPTENDPVYSDKIKLEENETTTIRAITINEKGYRSIEVYEEYKINMDGPESPSVEPSAGTYQTSRKITVTIPEGCRVYYTLDGSDPTADSTEYTGPVTMPDGKSIFSCIAINEYDMESSVIRRQYNLIELD